MFTSRLGFCLFLLLIGAALKPALGQSGPYFYEIPVPQDSVVALVYRGDPYTDERYIIRSGQQYLILRASDGSCYSARVFDGVNFTTLTSEFIEGAYGFRWTNPPTGLAIHHVSVFVSCGSGVTYSSDFDLVVTPPASRAFQADETVAALTIDNGRIVNRKPRILLWQAEGLGVPGTPVLLDKPLLLVEGIDAENKNNPASYFALGSSLFGRALPQGADILILDFADGGRDMALNAETVIGAVNLVRQFKTDPTRGIDLIGVSMGGVVSRYALSLMEQRLLSHDVARFVSVDSPQQGAVIDVELQQYTIDKAGTAPPPAALSSVAGKQLMKQNLFDPNYGTGYETAHQKFYREMRALNEGNGYPFLPENVAVSFGTAASNPDVNQEWLNVSITPTGYVDRRFYVIPPIDVAGSYLPLDNTKIWGIAYRAFKYVFNRTNDATFIPFESAHDLTAGVSKFDGPRLSPLVATYHDDFPEELDDDILNRLGYEIPAPSSVSISGPTSLNLDQRGVWSATTSAGPEKGYSYNWEYRLIYPWCEGSGGEAMQISGGSSKAQPSTGAKGDDPVLDAVTCGEWMGASPTAKFSYRSSTAARLELRVMARDDEGSVQSSIYTVYIGGGNLSRTPTTGLQIEPAEAPFSIEGVSPHPVRNGAARIAFSLPDVTSVTVVFYDALGREVRRLYDGVLGAGSHILPFDASSLPTGLYVCRVTADGKSLSRPVVVDSSTSSLAR